MSAGAIALMALERVCLGERSAPPISRPKEQPKGSLIQSGETVESIHFATPLKSLRQHGAKLSSGF